MTDRDNICRDSRLNILTVFTDRDDAFAEGLEFIADLFENMHVELF